MRKTSSVDWTHCSSCWILGCVILWFFNRHFTVDPINVRTYCLGRQVLSLWKVSVNQFISSFKLLLPRKKSYPEKNVIDVETVHQQEIWSRFLFVFMLLVLQEMSMLLLVPFCDFPTVSLHLQNLNVKFLQIFNQTHADQKPKFAEWHFLRCTSHKCRDRKGKKL